MSKKFFSFLLIFALMLSRLPMQEANAASSIALSKTTASLTAGSSITLTLTNVSTKNAGSSVWKSTNKKVAAVSFNKTKATATVKARKKGTAKIKAVYKNKTYICKITVTTNIIPANIDLDAQKLPLSGIKNARQLGSYPTTDGLAVKKNLLLRTAKLSGATDADLNTLTADFNLGYIIDLRAKSSKTSSSHKKKSKSSNSDPEIEGVTNVSAGFSGPSETAADGYVKSLKKDETIQAVKTFLETLITNKGEKAVLFHCSKGKDRTGIMAAILLSILHVSDEIIMGDYLLSSNYYDSCNQIGMENALDYMKEQSGTVEQFVIDKTGLSADDMTILRESYLE